MIGVEVVQKAIQDFFNENKISFEKKDVGENSHCYMVKLCISFIMANKFFYIAAFVV